MKSKVTRNFRFPEREEDVKEIHNMYHLIDLLRQKEREFGKYDLENTFDVGHTKTERVDVIYAKCKKCPSKLLYEKFTLKIAKHIYRLKYFNPTHKHNVCKNTLGNELFNYVRSHYKEEDTSDQILLFKA